MMWRVIFERQPLSLVYSWEKNCLISKESVSGVSRPNSCGGSSTFSCRRTELCTSKWGSWGHKWRPMQRRTFYWGMVQWWLQFYLKKEKGKNLSWREFFYKRKAYLYQNLCWVRDFAGNHDFSHHQSQVPEFPGRCSSLLLLRQLQFHC